MHTLIQLKPNMDNHKAKHGQAWIGIVKQKMRFNIFIYFFQRNSF